VRRRRRRVVITPHFIANEGWTREEFDGIFTRELVEKKDVLVPVWHEVTRQQVFDYSPTLANRVAIDWSLGADEVSRQLKRAIGD
jgi:hypothetical protein